MTVLRLVLSKQMLKQILTVITPENVTCASFAKKLQISMKLEQALITATCSVIVHRR